VGQELQVFDVRADAVVATRAMAAVLDPVAAAALVLSIKAWLQQPPEPPGSGSPRAEPPPLPQPSATAAPPPPMAAATVPVEEALPERPRAPTLALVLSAGSAWREHAPEARFGLAAHWWPSGGHLGLGLRVEAGPVSGQDKAFGQLRMVDAALSTAAVARVRLGSRFWLVGEAGPRMHWLRLWGTLDPVKAVPVDVARLVPALGLGLRGDWRLAPALSLGLWLDAGWLLRVQRYFVDGEAAFQPARLRVGLGLALGLTLD
jgi:hypothetical protein